MVGCHDNARLGHHRQQFVPGGAGRRWIDVKSRAPIRFRQLHGPVPHVTQQIANLPHRFQAQGDVARRMARGVEHGDARRNLLPRCQELNSAG
jgi:hypothetical protein